MTKNYLKIAWRNLMRHKRFSLINIAGLSIGLCCFLLILLFVLDELNYDRYNDKADRIYRINTDIHYNGKDEHGIFTSDMMGELLRKDNPQIENYTRVYTINAKKLVKKGNGYITEENVAYVDSSFFDIFTLPALQGTTDNALSEPNSVVISESMAKKYFGMTDVVGKTLEILNDSNSISFKINAVIKDIPENSHFRFDLLFPMSNLKYKWGNIRSNNFYTYLLLQKDVNAASFGKKISDQFIEKYFFPEVLNKSMNIKSMADFEKAGNKLSYALMPVTKIHLYSKAEREIRPSGSIQYVYIFSAVAVFILLIACINFMNLTTASSGGRAREIGIRKVLGTERKELITQFLAESIFMTSFSLLFALGLCFLILPFFNGLAGKHITMASLLSPYLLAMLVILPLAVGILAGSYPAFFMSSFKPVQVLKGKFNLTGKTISLREGLVVFQFTASIVLIIATVVVYRQLYFIQNKNLGFSKEALLIIDGVGSLGNNAVAFKNSVLQLSDVKSGTLSSFLPVSSSSRNSRTISKESVVDVNKSFSMQNWYVDYDYIRTMGMDLVKGRDFSRDFGADGSTVIINETAARILGYDNPIGKDIYILEGPGTTSAYKIIGVVKNFNYESLHQDIGPLGFFLNENTGLATFRVSTASTGQVIDQIRNKWKALATDMPFSYRFMDESFDQMYQAEQRVGRISIVFSILAIFIACLGIFGLATFMAERRMKEIGIRKVLGASIQGIVRLLCVDFIKMVLIAFVIAAPLAWLIMHKWLQDFAYRTDLSWWIFLIAGGGALLIALVTVSIQSLKAAIINPIKSLKSE